MAISADNKRIAKNTFYLYIRMIILIVVNFFTTRVVLHSLGVDDFGLYNVVAGFVTMIAFLNQTMINSIQRFYNYELGLGDRGNIKEYFETALLTQLTIGLFILILTETIGIWFLNNKMSIPAGKEFAANFVMQCSVFSLIISTLSVPFGAIIIAKEKMNFYALISLIEAVIQLLIAYIIDIVPDARLEIYASLLLFLAIIVFITNVCYSVRLIEGLKIKIRYHKNRLKDVLSFSGWNLFGASSGIIKSQGLNVLMNMFFGVTVNAARGIAYQVLACVLKFIGNFQIAINPQIVQSYSKQDFDRYKKLTFISAKISFSLMWILTLPILFCSNQLLRIWLEDSIPDYTSLFLKIILLTGVIDSLASSISVPIYATGKIRDYQIIVSSIILLILPFSYLAYKMGFEPAVGMWISLGLSIIAQFVRVAIWSKLIKISSWIYLRNILFPCFLIAGLTYLISYLINEICVNYSLPDILFIINTTLYTVALNATLIYALLLDSDERKIIADQIKKVFAKISKK